MDFDTIEEQFDEFDDVEFSGGVSSEAIDAAAMALGLPIEGEYRQFLQRFGCGSIEHEEFLGLGGSKALDVVSVTGFARERGGSTRFPTTFIPVLADGYGNYDCIDTSRKTRGESPVVYWLHDGGDDQDCEVLAPSYAQWFHRKLEEIREAIADDDE